MAEENRQIKVLKELPPLYDRIHQQFKLKTKNVIFAWGDRVYNPSGIEIPPEIEGHEKIHLQRQNWNFDDAFLWWEQYLNEDSFRLEEEILAHKAEWIIFCFNFKDRNLRAKYLHNLAMRLSSPLYGSLISHADAKKAII